MARVVPEAQCLVLYLVNPQPLSLLATQPHHPQNPDPLFPSIALPQFFNPCLLGSVPIATDGPQWTEASTEGSGEVVFE